jgi:hypothetical protein
MKVHQISLSAIKHVYMELDRFEKRAQKEMRDAHTRAIGIVRLDLVEECRRRLTFLRFMVKDAEEHASERRLSREIHDLT